MRTPIDDAAEIIADRASDYADELFTPTNAAKNAIGEGLRAAFSHDSPSDCSRTAALVANLLGLDWYSPGLVESLRADLCAWSPRCHHKGPPRKV